MSQLTDLTQWVRIQTAPVMDGMDDQANARYQKPFPFCMDAEGRVGQQDLWQGTVFRCLGVKHSAHTEVVDIFWQDIYANPSLALGKYPVFRDNGEGMFALVTGIVSADYISLPADF